MNEDLNSYYCYGAWAAVVKRPALTLRVPHYRCGFVSVACLSSCWNHLLKCSCLGPGTFLLLKTQQKLQVWPFPVASSDCATFSAFQCWIIAIKQHSSRPFLILRNTILCHLPYNCAIFVIDAVNRIIADWLKISINLLFFRLVCLIAICECCMHKCLANSYASKVSSVAYGVD